MSLRVAVQMDPIESINIGGDSTFAIMLSAQARGHRLWHYTADALSWADGCLWAMGYPVTVQRVAGDHYSFGQPEILHLGRDIDVVLQTIAVVDIEVPQLAAQQSARERGAGARRNRS